MGGKRRPNPPGTGQLPEGEPVPPECLVTPERYLCTWHAESGLWHRPEGSDDADIMKEARSSFRPIPWERWTGAVYLDLGAHIGIFTKMALDHGAGSVVAVEADPDNFWLLDANAHSSKWSRWWPVWAAVNDTGDDAVLYRNLDGIGKCMHSLVTKGRKVPAIVPGVSLDDLLAEHEPAFVKVDIEYGEYALSALHRLPPFVTGLFMELHLNSGNHRDMGRALYASLLAQGFEPVREARFTERNWSTCPILVR
jgi:FkbM family methyltransferase